MNVTIRPVETSYVNQVWPHVKQYIDESQAKGLVSGVPDYNTDQILVYLVTGQWMLIVAAEENGEIRGAMTLSFINYPMNRVAFVTAVGGKFIINKETLEQLGSIAKYNGATKIQAMARPSVERMLESCGFESGNKLMEYRL